MGEPHHCDLQDSWMGSEHGLDLSRIYIDPPADDPMREPPRHPEVPVLVLSGQIPSSQPSLLSHLPTGNGIPPDQYLPIGSESKLYAGKGRPDCPGFLFHQGRRGRRYLG